MTPISLGSNRIIAILLVVAGPLFIVFSILLGDWITALLGVLFTVLGVLQFVTKPLVITGEEVQVNNALGMTLRRFPVSSPKDLTLDGKKLMHVPSGKKIMTLGSSLDSTDVQQLKQVITVS